MNKTFLVLCLPSEDVPTATINQSDMFPDFESAFERYRELILESDPYARVVKPRKEGVLAYLLDGGESVQIWEVKNSDYYQNHEAL